MSMSSFRFKVKYNVLKIVRGFLFRFVRFPVNGVRVRTLRRLGFQVGQHVYIGPNLTMTVGYADTTMQLIVGDRVTFAPNVTLVLASGPPPRTNSRLRTVYVRPPRRIIIGEDTWIGANVTILPNVKIGKCCMVGAGAVVTHDVPDYSVVGGVPARIIKKIDPDMVK